MFSREARLKAVKLYIQYDLSYADVVRELGYPSESRMLKAWYKEYQSSGTLHESFRSNNCCKYSIEQKTAAVNYYFAHGKNATRACRKLGYPSRPMLCQWIDEMYPHSRKIRSGGLQYSPEQKKQAVIALCSRQETAAAIARKYGTTRENLYNWRRTLLGKREPAMPKKQKVPLEQPIPVDFESLTAANAALQQKCNELLQESENLKEKNRQLDRDLYEKKMELDILEEAARIIKKDPGVDLTKLSNREKTELAVALRNEYPLPRLLIRLRLPKSSYYYQLCVLHGPDKRAALKERVYEIFAACKGCYGYRRIHALLMQEGRIVSEKVIRRIMAERHLTVAHSRIRKYSSYQGEITPAVPNLLERNFHAEKPNEKWLTDITEFSIPAGKVYLSPIVDCYDGILPSWTIGTSPDAVLVNTMLDNAIATLHGHEKPIIHSDRGCHYRWPGWIERMEKSGLTRSMSKKGCSPDNSACEGFFGRLKNEMFYYRSWKGVTIDEFIATLNEYLNWYNNDRIKISLGGLSPMDYRRKRGLLTS